MAENLRTTRYLDGSHIPTNLSNEEWENTTSGAYAIYPHEEVEGINSDAEMVDAYGILYNWYAVDEPSGLCPIGWHVPTYDEWQTLVEYLGDWEVAGGKMKSTRTEPDAHPRWMSPNSGATNESGLTGHPGGIRSVNGNFGGIGNYGSWWSKNKSDHHPDYALARDLEYNSSSVLHIEAVHLNGLSVRCIMDSPSVELPTSPILASPANNATGVGISPRLRWHESEHATSYTIYITDNNGFEVDVPDIPDTSYYVTGLEHTTEYQWKVRAWNELGYSDWSETFTFTTISPPQAEETKAAPEGDNSTVEYDSGLQFTGDVQTSSECNG